MWEIPRCYKDTTRMADETNPLSGMAMARFASRQEEERPIIIVPSCCRHVASPATQLSWLSCCLGRQVLRVASLGVVQRRSLIAPPHLDSEPCPMMPQAAHRRRPNPRPEPPHARSRAPSPAGCPASPASWSSKRSPANTTTTGSTTAVARAASRRSRERERITMKRTGED
jgi:hypothetical protein